VICRRLFRLSVRDALTSALFSLVLLGAGSALAQPEVREAGEYEAKTAFLYAFAKYVTWPATAEGVEFSLCHRGDSPFGAALASLQGKQVHGDSISVRTVDDDLAGCHVLVGELNDLRDDGQEVLSAPGLLTVAHEEGFAAAGGILELTFVDDHLGFVINRAAARRAGLELGSSLLRLAQQVIEEDGREAP
jgi:hypothetical protein